MNEYKQFCETIKVLKREYKKCMENDIKQTNEMAYVFLLSRTINCLKELKNIIFNDLAVKE